MKVAIKVNQNTGIELNVTKKYDPSVLPQLTENNRRRIEAEQRAAKMQATVKRIEDTVHGVFDLAASAAREGKTNVFVKHVLPAERSGDKLKKGSDSWFIVKALREVGFNAKLHVETKEYEPKPGMPNPLPVKTYEIVVTW